MSRLSSIAYKGITSPYIAPPLDIQVQSISPSSSSVNEGSPVIFTVATRNAVDNTTLYWSLNSGGQFQPDGADFSTVQGTFTITGNSGFFSITPTADNLTEGAETFTVSISSDSIMGTELIRSQVITINDTSTSPPPSLIANITVKSSSVAGSLPSQNILSLAPNQMMIAIFSYETQTQQLTSPPITFAKTGTTTPFTWARRGGIIGPGRGGLSSNLMIEVWWTVNTTATTYSNFGIQMTNSPFTYNYDVAAMHVLTYSGVNTANPWGTTLTTNSGALNIIAPTDNITTGPTANSKAIAFVATASTASYSAVPDYATDPGSWTFVQSTAGATTNGANAGGYLSTYLHSGLYSTITSNTPIVSSSWVKNTGSGWVMYTDTLRSN